MTVAPPESHDIRWVPPTKDWTGRDPTSVHSRESLNRAWELSKGPKGFRPEPDETNPAISAAIRGDVAALREIVHRGGAPLEQLLDAPDKTGNSAFIWAADRNQEEVLQFLLGPEVLLSGLKIDAEERVPPPIDMLRRGYLGNTALSRAVRHNNVAVITLLLDAMEQLAELQGGTTTTSTYSDICNDKLQYPMHFAAFKVRLEALDLLLARGCNSFVVDRKGRTPLEDTASAEVKERIRGARRAIAGRSPVQHSG